MKLIFLDFDGVLNSQLYFKKRRAEKLAGHDLGVAGDLDPEAVGFLNEMIEKTGAKVVVSSTWRIGMTIEELQELLEKVGFKGEVVGITPDLRGGSVLRGNEILEWIKDNPAIVRGYYSDYTDYVIFDGDSDMLYWQRNNYFQCDGYVGLTPNVAYRATRFLTL